MIWLFIMIMIIAYFQPEVKLIKVTIYVWVLGNITDLVLQIYMYVQRDFYGISHLPSCIPCAEGRSLTGVNIDWYGLWWNTSNHAIKTQGQ